MNKEQYLQRKAKLKKLEQDEFKTHRELCFKCYKKVSLCMCNDVKSFDTNIHFVILMHPMEARKERVGTGRLTHLSLKNSQILTGVDFTEDKRLNALINDPKKRCLLLYPGIKAINLSEQEMPKEMMDERELVVIVIDGTWACAKKMMKLSKNLHQLPRVCFTPKERSLFHIKHQPDDFCLSTIESIYHFLSSCEKQGLENLGDKKQALIDIFMQMVHFQIDCAKDPNKKSYRRDANAKGYEPEKVRTRSKKWDTRSIIFKEDQLLQ